MYIPHSVNGFGGVRWRPPSKQVSMAVIFISFIFCYKIVLMFYNILRPCVRLLIETRCVSVNAQMEQDRCYALVAVILAVNFNRSKVFCSFFVSGQKIIYFFLVRLVYMMYICTNKTDKK